VNSTATSRRTGRKFSVECKHREPEAEIEDGLKLSKLGRTLRAALLKHANQDRIIFIDLNFPYDPKQHNTFPPQMDLRFGTSESLRETTGQWR